MRNATSKDGVVDESDRLSHRIADYISPNDNTVDMAKKVWRTLEPALPNVLEQFYQSVSKIPELSEKLGSNAERVPNLKSAQMRHWEHIFNNPVDIEFEGRAVRIGEAHVRTGLSVQWYMASYGRMLHEIIPVLSEKNRLTPGKLARQLQTLIARFFLDMILSYNAYEHGVVKLRMEENEREKNLTSLRNLANTVGEINDISANMAVLSENIRKASSGGQAISAASAELVTSVEQIADTSDSASRDADDTNGTIAEGLTAMQAVSETITDIAGTAEKNAQSLKGNLVSGAAL